MAGKLPGWHRTAEDIETCDHCFLPLIFGPFVPRVVTAGRRLPAGSAPIPGFALSSPDIPGPILADNCYSCHGGGGQNSGQEERKIWRLAIQKDTRGWGLDGDQDMHPVVPGQNAWDKERSVPGDYSRPIRTRGCRMPKKQQEAFDSAERKIALIRSGSEQGGGPWQGALGFHAAGLGLEVSDGEGAGAHAFRGGGIRSTRLFLGPVAAEGLSPSPEGEIRRPLIRRLAARISPGMAADA